MKSVGYQAFSGNPNLVRIYFGEGIEELREQVCLHCVKLESVSFPSTLRYMYNTFQECSSITTLEFPANLEYLGSGWCYLLTGLIGEIHIPAKTTTIISSTISSTQVTGIEVDPANTTYKSVDGCLLSRDGSTLYMVPSSSSWKTEYTTPSGVTKIEPSAFSNNGSLVSLTFREGVISALNAIGSLTALVELNLPASLTDRPFSNYSNTYYLSSITVAPDSNTFTSVDGVMFTKDLATLVRYPPKKEQDYTVPSTTKVLGSGSFCLCRLKSLTLNEGLLTLESDALRSVFKVSDSLGVLRIPKSVTSIAQTGLFEAYWAGFEVDTDHPLYSTDGSVLYNKDKTKAIVYTCDTSAPRDQELTLPSTVTEINLGLAYNNSPLVKMDLSQTKVTVLPQFTWLNSANDGVDRTLLLPNTLTRIQYNSIRIVSAKSLEIPASVTTIESAAIGLDNAEEIIFRNRGKFTSNSIFWTISSRCVVRGYPGSSAEDIALQYTLKFEALTD